MGEAFVKIDLHGMTQDEALRKIEQMLHKADKGTYQLQLIHGFHRGTALKEMIWDEYRHDKRVKKVIQGDNPGVTILVLRDLV